MEFLRLRLICTLMSLISLPSMADEGFAKNLLRTHASAQWIGDMGPALSDDPSAWFAVDGGRSLWIADLGAARMVDRVSLQHSGLSGSLMIETTPSIHLQEWQRVGVLELTPENAYPAERLIPSAGRFVRFSMEATSPGRLRGLGLFGPLRNFELLPLPIDAWTATSASSCPVTDFSLTNGLSLALVTSANTTRGALYRLRDEDAATAVRFSESESVDVEIDLGIHLALGSLVISQSNVEGGWDVEMQGRRYSGNVSDGTVKIDLQGSEGQKLILKWRGKEAMQSLHVYEIAVFPMRGLARSDGYGKDGYGKNGLGDGDPASEEAGPTIDGNGPEAHANAVSPYFGLRGAGPVSGNTGFPQRGLGGVSDDGGIPEITPGSR